LDDSKLFENAPVVYISFWTHLAPVTLLELELEKKLELSHTVGKRLRVVPERGTHCHPRLPKRPLPPYKVLPFGMCKVLCWNPLWRRQRRSRMMIMRWAESLTMSCWWTHPGWSLEDHQKTELPRIQTLQVSQSERTSLLMET